MAMKQEFTQCIPIVAKSHGQQLLTALYGQQQNGYFCDLWLFIENEKFAAHKSVLAAFSPYFQAMFNSGSSMNASKSQACNITEIHLSSVKKNVFLPILHFLYTSNLHLFKENITDILKTAKKLRIRSIVEICNNLMSGNCILPSLTESKQGNELEEDEIDQRANNNSILYIDLSSEDEEMITTKETMSVDDEAGSSTLETDLIEVDQVTRKEEGDNTQIPDLDVNLEPTNHNIFQANSFTAMPDHNSSIASSGNSSSNPASKGRHSKKNVSGGNCISAETRKRRYSKKSTTYCSPKTMAKTHLYQCWKCFKMCGNRQLLRSHMFNAHQTVTEPPRNRRTQSIDEIASLISRTSRKKAQNSLRVSLSPSDLLCPDGRKSASSFKAANLVQSHSDITALVDENSLDNNSALPNPVLDAISRAKKFAKASGQQGPSSHEACDMPPKQGKMDFTADEVSAHSSLSSNNEIEIKCEPEQFSEIREDVPSDQPLNESRDESLATTTSNTFVSFMKTRSASLENAPKQSRGFEKRVLLNAINKITQPVARTV